MGWTQKMALMFNAYWFNIEWIMQGTVPVRRATMLSSFQHPKVNQLLYTDNCMKINLVASSLPT